MPVAVRCANTLRLSSGIDLAPHQIELGETIQSASNIGMGRTTIQHRPLGPQRFAARNS